MLPKRLTNWKKSDLMCFQKNKKFCKMIQMKNTKKKKDLEIEKQEWVFENSSKKYLLTEGNRLGSEEDYPNENVNIDKQKQEDNSSMEPETKLAPTTSQPKQIQKQDSSNFISQAKKKF